MSMASYLLAACLTIQATPVSSQFDQVTPEPPLGKLHARSEGQARAVVLIHGLYIHPFSNSNVHKPLMRDWQFAGSRLAKRLAKDSDVYAYAYGQNAPVDEIAKKSDLLKRVQFLKKLGYREIVLVGHSAGGLIARQLVEDHPKAGVTKVIQVCSPNGGSSWAKYAVVRKAQKSFVRSLTQEAREQAQKERKGKTIPKKLDFVCLVGSGVGDGDGLVKDSCQWTENLQKQGIPAYKVDVTHWRAMRSRTSIDLIAEHVLKDHPRWKPLEVEKAVERVLED